MPRKTTILIVVLAAITGLLIFLAVRNESGPFQTAVKTTPEPTAVEPYATLGFQNPVIDVSSGSANQTADIVINTSGKPTAGAQVELSYNPSVITNVKLVPADNPFFGKDATVLISSVDATQGRVSYAVGLGANGTEKMGTGTVVRLSFTVNKASGAQSGQISFLDKSAVTTLQTQKSVLLSATPLQVVIAKPAPNQ